MKTTEYLEYYKGRNSGHTYYEREPIPHETRLLRRQERQLWVGYFLETKPNYFLTLTFNDARSRRDFRYHDPYAARRTYEASRRAVTRFHNRILRKLLGPRYAGHKNAQPAAIAFMEFASGRKARSEGTWNGQDRGPQTSPHYHAMYWVPDEHVSRFEALDVHALWKSMDERIHRTADRRSIHWDDDLSKIGLYVTKQYEKAPLDYEYIILGKLGEFERAIPIGTTQAQSQAPTGTRHDFTSQRYTPE